MKKLFLVLALLILSSIWTQGAFATCNSDTDKFNTSGWCIDKFGELTPQTIATGGTQTANQGGYQVPVVTVTAPTSAYSITSQQTGSVFADMGGVTSDTVAGAIGSKYILPRAAVGLMYTFTVGAKETITVDTLDTSDKILYSPSGTSLQMGDSIKNPGQAGDAVTLVATRANRWSITNQNGSSSTSGSTIDTLWLNNGTN